MRPINPNDSHDFRFIPREDADHCDGPWEECARCQFAAPLFDFGRRNSEPRLLCALCASTVVCYVGNAILFALGAFGAPPAPDAAS